MNWRHLIFLLLCFLCMMALMRYTSSEVKNVSGGVTILDLNISNSIEHIQETMTALGNDGREYYFRHFFIVDYFYAISYAAFYFCSIMFLLKKIWNEKRALRFLCVLPILGALSDWTENIMLSLIITNWPEKSFMLCVISNICTISKFVFVYASLAVVVILALIYFNSIKNKSK